MDGEEYRDTALLGHVCDKSGGSLLVVRGLISIEENALRLEQQLLYCLQRYRGKDVTAKVRTSQGFRLDSYVQGKGEQKDFEGEVSLSLEDF